MKATTIEVSVKDTDEFRAMVEHVAALHAAIDRGAEDGTLDCVVAGQTTNAGEPAPLCPEIIGDPRVMCAGCRIRTVRGVR